MAILSGFLGSRYCQPGTLQLGAGPGHVPADNDQDVQHNVLVTQIIGHGSELFRSITSSIAVTSTVGVRKAVNNAQFHQSSILVTQSIVERNVINRQEVTTDITVTSTPNRVGQTIIKSVRHDIAIASTQLAVGNRHIDVTVSENIHVTETIFFRNTVVRISVVSNITGSQDAAERDTIERESMTSSIVVTPHIDMRSSRVTIAHTQEVLITESIRISPNVQSVTDNIRVYGSNYPTNIYAWTNTTVYNILSHITITEGFTGGSSSRFDSVRHDITVDQLASTNFPHLFVSDLVHLVDYIVGGSDTRNESVDSAIIVSQSIVIRSTGAHIAMIDRIRLTQTIFDQGPILFIDVVDSLQVNQSLGLRIIPQQNVVHSIGVNSIISPQFNANRQTITDNIHVDSRVRSSPNRQSLQHDIVVQSRVQQLNPHLIDRITVTPKINFVRDRLVIDRPIFTQVVTVNRETTQSVRHDIAVASQVTNNQEFIRHITQQLYLPETDYLFNLDFHPSPIVVPVVIGIIVNTGLLSLQGQHGAITLPPAQLGDSVENVGKIDIKKSLDGTTWSYIQQTNRQRLKYKFRLPHLKLYELRTFVMNNFSDLLTMTNWKGELWQVKLVSDPFTFTNEGVWRGDLEFGVVELSFEGVKIGG